MLGTVRVEIVADNDADADPRIPKHVLARLGQDDVLMGATMMYARVMYVRAAKWETIKHRFPPIPTSRR